MGKSKEFRVDRPPSRPLDNEAPVPPLPQMVAQAGEVARRIAEVEADGLTLATAAEVEHLEAIPDGPIRCKCRGCGWETDFYPSKAAATLEFPKCRRCRKVVAPK